jgi:DNA-binding transcriptional MocR family regulator
LIVAISAMSAPISAGLKCAADAIASAERHGVAVSGLGQFDAGADAGAGRHPAALVVGYATPPQHACTTAIARLAAALGTVGTCR